MENRTTNDYLELENVLRELRGLNQEWVEVFKNFKSRAKPLLDKRDGLMRKLLGDGGESIVPSTPSSFDAPSVQDNPKPKKSPSSRRKMKPLNLEALKVIEKTGTLDFELLSMTLYGETSSEKEKEKNLNNTYARIRYFREQGWIVENEDGRVGAGPEIKPLLT